MLLTGVANPAGNMKSPDRWTALVRKAGSPYPVYFKGYSHIGEESFLGVKFQETSENNDLNRQDDSPGDENDGCLSGSLLRYEIDRRMAGDRREYGRLFAGTSPYIPYVSLMFGLLKHKANMRMI